MDSRNYCVLGIGVTWKQIEKLEMGMCDACFHSHMHAIPIYPSLNSKIYGLFQLLTSDIILLGFNSFLFSPFILFQSFLS